MSHAFLSASAAHRWTVCHAAPSLERQVADEGSAYAAEGTTAHELAALCLVRKWDSSALPDYAEGAEGADWSIYPPDMRAHVQEYLDLVRGTPGTMLVEQRVSFDQWVPEGFGTADAVIVNDGICTLIDLKYGQGVRVDAEANPQLMLYALGVLQEFGWLYAIDRFELVIHQPRRDHISEWAITTPDLLTWAETVVRPAAEKALDLHPEARPDPKACRFCRAKAVCTARHDANLKAAYEEFGPLPGAALLTDEQLAAALAKLDEIESWCGDLRAYALGQAVQGHPLPGWKLVEGRSIRTWNADVLTAIPALGLDLAHFIEPKLIGVGEAEKRLGGKKKAAEVLDQLTHKPQGKPTLAPAADKRPALQVASSAANDFTESS